MCYYIIINPRSLFVTTFKDMREAKWRNMNIGVGYVFTSKFGDMEKKTSKERIRIIRKEVVGCVQNVVGGNKFLVNFKD